MAESRGPIQLIPPGLLGLLQLKADGRTVPYLEDTCSPILSMEDWWLRAAAVDWTLSTTDTEGASTPNGFLAFATNGVTVPVGEWWFVHEYCVTFFLNAAEVVTGPRLAWSSIGSGASARFTVLPDGLESLANLTGAVARSAAAFRFWVPPGSRIGYFAGTITNGLNQVRLNQLRYTPCRV